MKYSAPPQLPELRRLYVEDGLSPYALCKLTGIPSTTIAYWLKQSGVKMRTKPPTIRGPTKAKGPTKPCIRCQVPFVSAHKFNRLCKPCGNYIKANSSSFAPGW